MPALTSGDAERLLRFVAEAESLGGDQPFTSDLLGELGRLVPAEVVAYNELDRVRRRDLLLVVWPDEEDVEFEDDVIWRVILEEHPLCLQQREGRFDAMKLSDFLTQRELHGTWVYDNWFRPLGIEHQLEVAIPSPEASALSRECHARARAHLDRTYNELDRASRWNPPACQAEVHCGRKKPKSPHV